MTSEQILKMQGWSDANIAKLQSIMTNAEAYQYAMKTSDLEGAYKMTLPKEKDPSHDLVNFFKSYVAEFPDDAKNLSTALSEFATFVQLESDKEKAQ